MEVLLYLQILCADNGTKHPPTTLDDILTKIVPVSLTDTNQNVPGALFYHHGYTTFRTGVVTGMNSWFTSKRYVHNSNTLLEVDVDKTSSTTRNNFFSYNKST